jgi:putative endonuclease
MFYVYVLYSKSLSKRYVGSSSDINKRLIEHNSGKSKFTKGGIPWRLIYSEQFDTNSEARKREIFLKSGNGRKFLDSILTSAAESSEPD